MVVECAYCEEKINAKRGIYIKCTACQDINLCLECFSAGAILASHRNDHPYELIDCGSFSILDDSWKAFEELSLLEAIELYGIGSWNDIANAVETRTADECRDRYLSVYVENFFGRRTWDAVDHNLYTVTDHTCQDNQPISPCLSLAEPSKIVDISREQQIRLGYMPKRDDFEREYDNEAEFLVSKLAVNANDDTELDQQFKIAHINMYTDRLRERFRRKRVVLEYNLVKLFFHMHPEENGDTTDNTNLQYNASSALNVALNDRHSLSSDQDIKLPNLNYEQSTTADFQEVTNSTSKSTSDNINSFPANSILHYFSKVENNSQNTDHAKVRSNSQSKDKQDYSILSTYFTDLNKTIAEKDFNSMEEKLRIFCQFSTSEIHHQLIRNLAREKELKLKIKELMKKRKNGCRKLEQETTDPYILASDDCSSVTASPARKKISVKNQLTTPVFDGTMDVDESESRDTANIIKKRSNGNSKALNNLSFNPKNESGYRLLTASEKKLCKNLNLKPSQYISFKAFLLKGKKRGASQRLFTGDIDTTVKRRIQNFLARNNWIKV